MFEELGLGRALWTLVPLVQRILFCVPFSVSLFSPSSAATWLGAGGEDLWALDGIFFCVLSVDPGMIFWGQGDALGMVDSVVPRMISLGRSDAVAYGSLSCGGSLLSLRLSSKKSEKGSRNDPSGRVAKEPRRFFSVWR